ncbi:MAG: hypothetical protein KDJ72_08270 [Methyloceanibacter sp.]|uniref:hypothetical protein n=1 Tax=Methyloceanibacter sp. TaxID=1965321 RepID=UPI001DEE8476|nr:hypothetical protein [Methyloceanibacter sp.]MCB1443005.1 hypothetical protein [Methyloceanibacter sp.]MCC0058096.1 hypothetical protein [Hyphomicrobiaceae bacterium]
MTDGNGAKPRQIAHGLIQGYLGPDHKVIDIKEFFSAFVLALRDAGQMKRSLLT